MSDPNLLFNMRLNKARHDKDFQKFLALCFGERFIAREEHRGMVFYRWRGISYVVQVQSGLPYVPLPGTLERINPSI